MSNPNLPSGFRFIPTDSDLIYFLKDKLLDRLQLPAGLIPDNINPYTYDPVQLPKGEDFKHDNNAFFFIYKQENRTIKDGFWRAFALPKKIFNKDQMIGFKEEFVFSWSIQNEIIKTNWIMYEYSINPAVFSDDQQKAIGNNMESYIVCGTHYRPSHNLYEEELEELIR
ncbi:NAC domain-containing protein 1-like [Telopea speciosissima]|uniref:NAC domain-containing protein 1-like n=1 Tax=Telopea speciosissima TaxID=54955 RepID=UPI001CC5C456|nr:NAC domain-containing protein 1-like [Telopea speciosissima]